MPNNSVGSTIMFHLMFQIVHGLGPKFIIDYHLKNFIRLREWHAIQRNRLIPNAIDTSSMCNTIPKGTINLSFNKSW